MAKKKVVSVTKTAKSTKSTKSGKGIKPTTSRTKVSKTANAHPIIYGKKNYTFMGVGVLLMILGFFAMSGGGMEDPNVWDESIIYGFRRITLAPMLIIAGLVLQIFAIFSKA